jgi:hypothetical protein
MARRYDAGSGNTSALLLLLLLLLGAGGFNYYRNVQAESAEPRPYRGHSDESLEQLLAAYEGRREQQSARYEAAVGRRAVAQERAYYDEKLRELERVQAASRRTAQARDALAGTQVVVKQIREEQAKRAEERNKLMLFLKRAFTL